MATPRGHELAVHSYAQALFNVAKSQGAIPVVIADAKSLEEALAGQHKLSFFLDNPKVSTEAKHGLINKILAASLHPLLANLLKILVDRERTILLSGILAGFEEIAERAEGLFPAQVYSARPLGADEMQNLQKALEKFTGSRLKIKFMVKKELIGGILFRFRDTLVDGTVRQGLREIRELFNKEETRTA